MGTLTSHSGMSSGTPSISDLDGYTIRDYAFPPSSNFAQDDEFGFDPPQPKAGILDNSYDVYSPPTDLSLSGWPEFERDDDIKPSLEVPIDLDAYEIDKFMTGMPKSENSVTRFGQVTPPRSNSAASTDFKTEEKLSPKASPPERRKRTKTQPKDPEPSAAQPKSITAGRKRKSTRKASTTSDGGESHEDQKRKQSLEKNRLAAAKCRVNKKEKTERLQRDSHDKAVENAYLKEQVMRMKDEIQQMNALLVAHASCEGCKSPEEIQGHLNALGNEYLQHQMALARPGFADFSQMNFSEVPVMPDNFYSQQLLHPPLPEFNRSADFEVHTPMAAD